MIEILAAKVTMFHLMANEFVIGIDKEAQSSVNCSKHRVIACTENSSSPTSADSSEEFDMEYIHNDVADDVGLMQIVEGDENELPVDTTQLSGIDTVEVATVDVSLPQQPDSVKSDPSLPMSHSIKDESRELESRRRETVPTEETPVAVVDELTCSSCTTTEHQPSTTIKSPSKLTTVVQFSTVTVRDYPRSIGDNPASSIGPSLSIGWKHESESTVSLDKYEENRGPRRCGREMIVPYKIREELLRNAGYSRADIMKCIRELNIIRLQRRRTYETLHLQPFQLLSERISRKAWNVLTFGEYKRKERATLQIFHPSVLATSSVTSK